MIRERIIKYDDDKKKKDIHGGFPLIEAPIELIRCKDCKYYDGNGTCMKNGIAFLIDHWFCADGEPKD